MLGRYENDLNPILKTTEEEINTNKNIPYLVDQHLLDKDNA